MENKIMLTTITEEDEYPTLSWYQKVEWEFPLDEYVIQAQDFMSENPNATKEALRREIVVSLRDDIDCDLGEEIAYNLPTILFDFAFNSIIQKINETKEDE